MELKQETVDKIIEGSSNASEAVLGLIKAAVPDFDKLDVVKIPRVSDNTNKYIYEKVHDLDPEGAPLMWLQYGFGVQKDAEDWKVYPRK